MIQLTRDDWEKHPSLWTQEHLAYFAECEGGGTFNTEIEKYDIHWTFFENYPLSKLGSRESWIQWYNEERDGREEYFDELEKAWSKSPLDVAPVILIQDPPEPTVVQGVPKNIDVGDGYHRIGISMLLGMETLPAVVGCVKGKK